MGQNLPAETVWAGHAAAPTNKIGVHTKPTALLGIRSAVGFLYLFRVMGWHWS